MYFKYNFICSKKKKLELYHFRKEHAEKEAALIKKASNDEKKQSEHLYLYDADLASKDSLLVNE